MKINNFVKTHFHLLLTTLVTDRLNVILRIGFRINGLVTDCTHDIGHIEQLTPFG